jgi:hypothetical protein
MYVFNGDFVDRGTQQVEVVALLFSLKVCFPDRVLLIRGNHEFRDINAHMSVKDGSGFDQACTKFFGHEIGARVYESVHSAFDWLPFAALIENEVFVVHGGIGAGQWSSPGSMRPDIDWLDSKACLRPITCTDPSTKPPAYAFRWIHLHNIVCPHPPPPPPPILPSSLLTRPPPPIQGQTPSRILAAARHQKNGGRTFCRTCREAQVTSRRSTLHSPSVFASATVFQ